VAPPFEPEALPVHPRLLDPLTDVLVTPLLVVLSQQADGEPSLLRFQSAKQTRLGVRQPGGEGVGLLPSSGVCIWDLEMYITKPLVKNAEIVQLTPERWVLEIYRTVIDTLQGLA
jgi:hypothetical protein